MAARSLSSKTYDELLRRLLGGQLRPGQDFNRRQLAKDLGVSVAPLLEALVILECEGLIVTTPRKGTRVRSLTPHEMHGLLVTREALECQAARLACGAPVERHADALRTLAEQIDGLTVQTPADVRTIARFHHQLVMLSAVPSLVDAYERILKRHLLFAAHDPTGAVSAQRGSYRELVATLEKKDADLAEAAMRSLLRSEFRAGSQEKIAIEMVETPSWLQS